MEQHNPFSISFGRKPLQYVDRLIQTEEILSDLRQEIPTSPVYMITGVRGSGKTVLMASIAKELSEDENCIVIDVNPNVDILQSCVVKLYETKGMKKYFIDAKIELSQFGLGVTIEKARPASDLDAAMEKMMSVVKKHDKKVLITIDEVSNTPQMRVFASSVQMLIYKDYPVNVLMTGLYENIYDLQNVDNLTFLYRAQRVFLSPLNFAAVKNKYMQALGVDEPEAGKMASMIKGYPFGFQVLGFLYWKQKPKSYLELIPQFDQYMDEYVYSKIWSELSTKDRAVLQAMTNVKDGSIKIIRELAGISPQTFSTYRERLLRKGVVVSTEHGHLKFSLPRFAEFVKNKYQEYE